MKKFEQVIPLSDFEVMTPFGWKDATKLIQTEEFQEYELKTDKGSTLYCADKHNIIMEDGNEHFVDELFVGMRLKTKSGVEIVTSVKPTNRRTKMYDLEVPDGHVYYTNDIASHNTTTTMAYLLHQAITRSNITIAILANKGDTAAEVLARIKFAYESLPWYLQVGVKTWNKKSIELGNGSKIITAATSGSSIRGKSVNCVSGDTMVTILNDDGQEINTDIGTLYSNAKEYKLDAYENITTNGAEFHKSEYFELAEHINKFDTTSKYFGIYLSLMVKALNRPQPETMIEKHHVLPRSMGGSDAVGNMVSLTLREHFVAHKLLPKIVKEEYRLSMGRALFMMSNTRGLKMSSAEYEVAKVMARQSAKKYKCSDEARKLISAAQKKHWEENKDEIIAERIANGHYERSGKSVSDYAKENPEHRAEWQAKINKNPEKIAKTAEAHRGMKRSDASKERMSAAAKGRKPPNTGTMMINNGSKVAYISKTEPIPAGWHKGGLPTAATGKMVINNGVENKMIPKTEPIPDGWVKGVLRGNKK